MVAKLTFKTADEAKVFCKALESRTDVDGNRFKAVSTISKNNPETYVRKGATVDFVWRYLDDDRKTPTKPTTTSAPTTSKAPDETTQKPTAPTTTQAPTTVTEPVTAPIM